METRTTRLIQVDEEQAALLHAATEMSHAALSARAARVDPDGKISLALQMSRNKMQTLMNQLEQPPLPKFSELSKANRKAFMVAITQFASAETTDLQDAFFDEIRVHTLRRLTGRARPKAIQDQSE